MAGLCGCPAGSRSTSAGEISRGDSINAPAYAVDDETAFVVVDGQVEIVGEGTWTRLR